MKRCPQCSTIYTDDMTFCLSDGTVLLSSGELPTMGHSARLSTPPAPTMQASPIAPAAKSRMYLIVALLALIMVIGVLIAIIVSRTSAPNNNANPAHNTTPERSPANKNVNENGNSFVLPPMTPKAAEDLIIDWENAQDNRNFGQYKALYDPSFQGIKRTVSGKVYKYNYTEWMKDRRKTMGSARFLDVRIEGRRISVQDDIATIEFDQYYRTTGYADFGPKVIRAKMTASGAKIIYEELISSTPLPK